ncbi:MAG: hypothetical protein ABEJ56_06335 [Candidatus Nanohaloarchaea archaeon]
MTTADYRSIHDNEYRPEEMEELALRNLDRFETYFRDEVEGIETNLSASSLENMDANPGFSNEEIKAILETAEVYLKEMEVVQPQVGIYRWSG